MCTPENSLQHGFNSPDLEVKTEPSIAKEMHKEDRVHIYKGVLLSHETE